MCTISVARSPMQLAPRSLRVARSKTSFTMPSWSPMILPRALSSYMPRPMTTSRPFAFASSSERPTQETSGMV